MEPYIYKLVPLSNAKELDEVVAIWIAGSETAHHFIDLDYWLRHVEAMREVYIPQSETWIYKDSANKVLGFISLVNTRLASLFVSPDAQGSGIGSRLLEKAKELRNHLGLTVYVKNTNAVHFYKKHGFTIEDTRVDENTQEEEYYMVWNKN
ncbi:N-acetyltransferase [Telluribacter sp. SYSU D00476]|uniref:N-acetyltransferase n=1 Tax=Telluribacter sp. SYSU D00476 TaxID=2811430 RepID=UPI001FF23DAD|nr:N-acetyltransferase [Telluribacter sp. SYSU D00476]